MTRMHITHGLGNSESFGLQLGQLQEASNQVNHDTKQINELNGVSPLTASTPDWLTQTIEQMPIADWVQQYGSPLHLHYPQQFKDNVHSLYAVAEKLQVPLEVYFARKANKSLAYVEACRDIGCGIDVASLNELQQCLQHNVQPSKLVCTAAVKSNDLIAACLASNVTIVIDNLTELEIVQHLMTPDTRPRLCLRISHFQVGDKYLESRFGIPLDDVADFLLSFYEKTQQKTMFEGLHFHLAGYSAYERQVALDRLVALIFDMDILQKTIRYIDIGGGFPVNYLQHEHQWHHFWQSVSDQTEQQPVVYKADDLGLSRSKSCIGSDYVYPFYQEHVRQPWFEQIFAGSFGTHSTLSAIQHLKIAIHCEPGRYLLDNTGATVARVAHVKQQPNGFCHVNLEMNHTQCRTGSRDYLLDPMSVQFTDQPASKEHRGYLFGSYCTETDLICQRTFRVPATLKRGDLVILKNTAGYFMHFRESQSHQLGLASNLILKSTPDDTLVMTLDLLDQSL